MTLPTGRKSELTKAGKRLLRVQFPLEATDEQLQRAIDEMKDQARRYQARKKGVTGPTS